MFEKLSAEEAYQLGFQAGVEDLQKAAAERPLAPGEKPGPVRATAKLPMDNPTPLKKNLVANPSPAPVKPSAPIKPSAPAGLTAGKQVNTQARAAAAAKKTVPVASK